MKKPNYEKPRVEIIDLATEQAFASSALDSAAFDDSAKNEIDLFLEN